ncbi:peptide cleavage/export ABC transporter [Lactobacillus sp. CC-MHH1034]|uniref:peptide cleavage/export ABC transporter n=1 Tax=Agrilactobacillus fermenti TaxID=2586909 RepID=UPI001E4F6157|nr:peptide cleavage/export ABC transporter [Agrilactobacillus fermenti]MCD2255757.1 peptide cleavage/export ABC transporter [Agrilactobacillus fermenti]
MKYFKNRRDYVPQVDERDCGVAALAMILRHFGSQYSLAHLRDLAKTDMAGTTALGIVEAAETLDLETKPIRADATLFDVPDLPFPFIAHVLKQGRLLHYYVVFGQRGDKLLIGDPDPTVGLHKMAKADFLKEWSGVAIFFAPKPGYQSAQESKNSLFSYVPMMFKQHHLITNIIVASILVTLISILGSYYLQGIIDTFIPSQMVNTLGIISVGLLCTYILQQVLTFGQNYLLAVLGQRLSIDVILAYIRHIFELPMSFFATRRTGEIISRFTDANKIIDALARTIISMFLDVWIALILAIVLAVQSTQLFWITLIAIPLYIVVIYAFVKPFEKYNQDTMQSNAMLSSSIIEDINGIETVKSLNAEDNSYQKVDREFVAYLRKSFTYQKLDLLQQALKAGIQLVVNTLVLWLGANLVMQNKLSLGQLITYNALLSYFTNPIQNIINLQTKLQMARVANNRLNEVYLVESEFKQARPIKDVTKLKGALEFAKVDFKYGFGRNTLTAINLKIEANSKLAIVGMSGSGKTTLVKLLVGFFEPTAGQILVNGHQTTDIDKHTLRQYVNYVPQEPYVFNGTVLENLTLGSRPDVTTEDITAACAFAEIQADIEALPLGYKTELSENGATLSGGQKQRLTIARALLTSAQVLIFDESTSNLDAITEQKIVQKLLALKDKTVIFIAHRLNIAKLANNIVVLDHGKLVEKGTHQSLLDQAGYYADLVNQ